MSLKQLLIASYGQELYKQTALFQQMKIRNALAKNQMMWLLPIKDILKTLLSSGISNYIKICKDSVLEKQQ